SALFFLIGTTLFAFYSTHDADMQELRQVVARQRLMQKGVLPPAVQEDGSDSPLVGEYQTQVDAVASDLSMEDLGDRAFPLFIAKWLPPGVTGLLIAAVFAAAMSTVSTSLNSSATLVMGDFYLRFFNREASDRQS